MLHASFLFSSVSNTIVAAELAFVQKLKTKISLMAFIFTSILHCSYYIALRLRVFRIFKEKLISGELISLYNIFLVGRGPYFGTRSFNLLFSMTPVTNFVDKIAFRACFPGNGSHLPVGSYFSFGSRPSTFSS